MRSLGDGGRPHLEERRRLGKAKLLYAKGADALAPYLGYSPSFFA
jgi:hypothetical protein